MFNPIDFKFTDDVKEYSVVPDGLPLMSYSKFKFVLYDLKTMSEKNAQMLFDKIETTSVMQSKQSNIGPLGGLNRSYFIGQLYDDKVRYIICANTNTTIGQYPIAFIMLSQMKINCVTVSIEILFSLQINKKVRVGLGVMLMTLALKHLRDVGVRYVELEAASRVLVTYYNRFLFILAQRIRSKEIVGIVQRKLDEVFMTEDTEKLERFVDNYAHQFRTPSNSYRMRLSEISDGIDVGETWAKMYIDKGLPDSLWNTEIELKDTLFHYTTPHTLFLSVVDGQYHIYNAHENKNRLFLRYGDVYTIIIAGDSLVKNNGNIIFQYKGKNLHERSLTRPGSRLVIDTHKYTNGSAIYGVPVYNKKLKGLTFFIGNDEIRTAKKRDYPKLRESIKPKVKERHPFVFYLITDNDEMLTQESKQLILMYNGLEKNKHRPEEHYWGLFVSFMAHQEGVGPDIDILYTIDDARSSDYNINFEDVEFFMSNNFKDIVGVMIDINMMFRIPIQGITEILIDHDKTEYLSYEGCTFALERIEDKLSPMSDYPFFMIDYDKTDIIDNESNISLNITINPYIMRN